MEPAVKDHELTFEELCKIVAPIAAKHRMIKVYLFGSRARGDNRKDSDFDFCVLPPENCGFMELGALLYELKDALGANVDLVSEGGLSRKPSVMEEVLHDRKIIFEA